MKLTKEQKQTSKIKFKNRPNNSYDVGEKLVWESRSPALVAIIIAKFEQEEYVLIGKRGIGAADNQGRFNCPCGYLDWDENGYDGICREVYEETGFYIPDIEQYDNNNLINDYISDSHMKQPFYVNTDPKENRQNVSLSYGLSFVCDKELPRLTIENCEPDEVAEVKWLKLSQMKSYDFAFDHDKRIKYYLDKRNQDIHPFL